MCAKSLQSCLTLQPTRLLCPWVFSRQEYWSELPCPPPRDLPNPGIKPRNPILQVDSLAAEPQGKPENTGVGSLSLLQGIFPTQGSNLGLLHFRQILYRLSHQGSPGHSLQLHGYKCWFFSKIESSGQSYPTKDMPPLEATLKDALERNLK